MKVLLDTNVILDVLIGRKPYVESSSALLKLCGAHITGLITASQTTDIFYILRREGKNIDDAKNVIRKLSDHIKIIDVIAADVKAALDSDMQDYEDALLAFNGKRNKVDYIITRNETDYVKSPVQALSPIAFLEKFFRQIKDTIN